MTTEKQGKEGMKGEAIERFRRVYRIEAMTTLTGFKFWAYPADKIDEIFAALEASTTAEAAKEDEGKPNDANLPVGRPPDSANASLDRLRKKAWAIARSTASYQVKFEGLIAEIDAEKAAQKGEVAER